MSRAIDIKASVALPTDHEGFATFDEPARGYTVALATSDGREPLKLDAGPARSLARELDRLADHVEAANAALFPKRGQLRMEADAQRELVV
jgi:hypothetical protein